MVRKEIHLDKTIIDKLQDKAKEDKRLLKNWMEKLFEDIANDDVMIIKRTTNK